MSKKDEHTARKLDVKDFYSIAQTVQHVMAEVSRVKNSIEMAQIIKKGVNVVGTSQDAVAAIRSDVTDIIALSLELYDKSLLRSRTLDAPKAPMDIQTREDLLVLLQARLAEQEG